jgi:holliday junction DNA helicase RuvA
MIGRLTGKLISDDVDGTILLDVVGVGYEVTVPLGAVGRAQKAARDGALVLFVHTHVREDALDLFGFASLLERTVFRLLISLPNIGPKLALSVLSSLPPAELSAAVQANDLRRLNKIPGVGKKTAERLVLELKEKLPKLGAAKEQVPTGPSPSGDRDKLFGALVNMGYKPAEAEPVVEALAARIGQEPISDLLREALLALAR